MNELLSEPGSAWVWWEDDLGRRAYVQVVARVICPSESVWGG